MTSSLQNFLCLLSSASSRSLNYLTSMLESFFRLTGCFDGYRLKILTCGLENLFCFSGSVSSRLGNLLTCVLEGLFSLFCSFSRSSSHFARGSLQVVLSFLNRNMEFGSECLHDDSGPSIDICSLTWIMLANIDHVPLRVTIFDDVLITQDPQLKG
jgi:hypothetical protein